MRVENMCTLRLIQKEMNYINRFQNTRKVSNCFIMLLFKMQEKNYFLLVTRPRSCMVSLLRIVIQSSNYIKSFSRIYTIMCLRHSMKEIYQETRYKVIDSKEMKNLGMSHHSFQLSYCIWKDLCVKKI